MVPLGFSLIPHLSSLRTPTYIYFFHLKTHSLRPRSYFFPSSSSTLMTLNSNKNNHHHHLKPLSFALQYVIQWTDMYHDEYILSRNIICMWWVCVCVCNDRMKKIHVQRRSLSIWRAGISWTDGSHLGLLDTWPTETT